MLRVEPQLVTGAVGRALPSSARAVDVLGAAGLPAPAAEYAVEALRRRLRAPHAADR